MSLPTILFIVLAACIALGFGWFQYGYKSKNKLHLYWLLGFLRSLSIFSLLLLLINPTFESTQYYTEKPTLVIAVDNSLSIKHLKQDTVTINIVNALKKNTKIKDKFNLEWYTFGKTLNSSYTLNFKETQTNIAETLEQLQQIYNNTSKAPTLLITDGNQTYGNDYEFFANNYSHSIYPVILGDTITHTDLKIEHLNVNRYAFLKNNFPVEVILTYSGNHAVTSKFIITSGKTIVYSKTVTFSDTQNSKILNFNLHANTVGLHTYKAQIIPLNNEKNTINNINNFAVEVINQKTNIALVSDIIHPDLGAIKKSIEHNEQHQVSILKPTAVNLQDSDYQLFILYQPNQLFKTLIEDLNTKNKNVFIISGTQTNWLLLNKLDLPFTHDITSQTEHYQGALAASYHAFILEDIGFESLPPLKSAFGEFLFKVPHQVILYKKIGTVTTNQPLLATYENGNKRGAVWLGENLWQWRAQTFLQTETFEPFDDFFGKIVQYLSVSTRKTRLVVDFQSFYNGNTNVVIKAQYFNKNFEFDPRETLNITVTNDSTAVTNTFPFILKNNNYEVNLNSLSPGKYTFTVKTTNENITKSGQFTILEYRVEEQFLNANIKKLQRLAANTKGQWVFQENYQTLIKNLLADDNYKSIQKSKKIIIPLIDWYYLLIILILSLSAEWFIRKYIGLT